MHFPAFDSSPANLGNCSSRQVEDHLKRDTRLLVPLGALEAYGRDTPLAAATVVCEALTVEVSKASGALFAPAFAYGCSLPFSAFAGTGGVRLRVLLNALTDLIREWVRQGFRRLLVVDVTWGNREALDEALDRVKGERGAVVAAYRWEDDSAVRECVQRLFGRVEQGRWDMPLLCMASHLLGTQVRLEALGAGKRPDDQTTRNWIRRGRDPERFRKLFPSALLWPVTQGVNPQHGAESFGLAAKGAREALARLG